jgi:hypothetical protein
VHIQSRWIDYYAWGNLSYAGTRESFALETRITIVRFQLQNACFSKRTGCPKTLSFL